MSTASYKPGEWVVFTTTKFSVIPGPRANHIHPVQAGDGYSYTVDKFWIVIEVTDDGQIVLQTRRGKRHTIRADDFRLRRATMLEQHRHKDRYREIERGIRPSTSAS